MNASSVLEMMEAICWRDVRTATDLGNAMMLMHLHKALKEFSRARACAAVQMALEARNKASYDNTGGVA